ncbi:hypothetical protein GCM10010219_25850 [Streptomyces netropsis]|nr:hypothetical protein GCM10010219_25850 [Streptomyces netropsis]
MLDVPEHSALVPVGPVDRDGPAAALASGSQRFPTVGVGVEEAVGGRVAALPEVTEVGGDRREQDEEVQRLLARQLVQVDGSVHLGRQDPVEVGLRRGQGVGTPHDARAVEDPVQRAEPRPGRVQRDAHRVAVGDVAAQVLDLRARRLQRRDPLPQARVQCPAAEQDEPRPALLGQVPAEVPAEFARSAADEVDAVLLQGQAGRHGVHATGPPPQHPRRTDATGTPDLLPAAGGRPLRDAEFVQHPDHHGLGVPHPVELEGVHPDQVVHGGHGAREPRERLRRRPGGSLLPRHDGQVMEFAFEPGAVCCPEEVEQALQLDRAVRTVRGQGPEVGDGEWHPPPQVHGGQQPVEVRLAAPVDDVVVRGVLFERRAGPHLDHGSRMMPAEERDACRFVVEDEQGRPGARFGARFRRGVFRHPARHVEVQVLASAARGRRLLHRGLVRPVGPELLTGEGVGGQGRDRRHPVAEQALPLQVVALAVQVGQRAQGVQVLAAVAGRVARTRDQLVGVLGERGLRCEVPGTHALERVGCFLSFAYLAEQSHGFLGRGREQCAAVREVVPADEEGGADPGEIALVLAPVLQEGQEFGDLRRQRLGGFGREHEEVGPRGITGVHGLRRVVPLDDDVGVRSADSEGADCPQPLAAGPALPGTGLLVDVEGTPRPVDVVAVLLAVQARGQGFVPQRLHQADQAHHPGRGQGVTEVALDRGQCAVLLPVGVPAEGVGEGVHLDGVAEPGAGAVRHHVLDPARVDAEPLVHGTQQRGLRRPAGRGDPVRTAVVVDAASLDDGVDPVPVRLRLREALQHHDGDRLAHDHPVGALVEGAADAVVGQHPGPAGVLEELGGREDVDARGERGVALAGAQAHAGLVHSGQPGRARRVDREDRSGEVQEVPEARCQDAVVGGGEGFTAAGDPLVVALFGTDEHAHRAVAQLPGAVARVLQCPPRLLEQQSLPRVHGLGLAGDDLEEQRVELGRAGQPSALGFLVAGRAGPVPPSFRRKGPDHVPAAREDVPEVIGCPRLREASAQTDDGDVVLAGSGGRCGTGLRPRRPGGVLPHGQRILGPRVRPRHGFAVILDQVVLEHAQREVRVEVRRCEFDPVVLAQLGGQPGVADRVEAQVGELVSRLDAVRRQLEDAAGDTAEVGPDQVRDLRPATRLRGELLGRGVGRRVGRDPEPLFVERVRRQPELLGPDLGEKVAPVEVRARGEGLGQGGEVLDVLGCGNLRPEVEVREFRPECLRGRAPALTEVVEAVGGVALAYEALQLVPQFGDAPHDERRPDAEVFPSQQQGGTEVHQVDVGPRPPEPVGQVPGPAPQRRFGPAGQADEVGGTGLRRDRLPGRRLLQDHVRVRPAEAERADPGAAWDRLARLRALHLPLPQGIHDVEGGPFQRDGGVQLREVRQAGYLLVRHREQDLDDARDPRGGLEVADVRFDRAEAAVVVRSGARVVATGLPEAFHQSADLDRVAGRRTGAVRFDVADGLRRDTRLGESRRDDPGLRVGTGMGEAAGPPAVADGAAPDHTVDAVAVAKGVRERFEQHQAAALAAHVPVRAFVEGLAGAGRGQHPDLGERDGPRGRQHQADAARDRDAAFLLPQGLHGQVHGVQRCGGCRVDGHAGTGEVEEVGYAVGDDGARRPSAVVRGRLAHLRFLQPLVVQVEGAEEDPDVAAGQLTGAHGGVLEAGPGEVQHDPLLRVHALRLQRRHTEERGVEGFHVRQEGAPPAGSRALGVRVRPPVPAASGHLADVRAAALHSGPELAVVVSSGEPTGHADDGDVVALHRKALFQTPDIPIEKGHDREGAAIRKGLQRRVSVRQRIKTAVQPCAAWAPSPTDIRRVTLSA